MVGGGRGELPFASRLISLRFCPRIACPWFCVESLVELEGIGSGCIRWGVSRGS